MKFKVLAIAFMFTVFVQGAVFAQGNNFLKMQADKIWEQASALYEKEKFDETIALLLKNKNIFTRVGDYYYAAVAKWLGSLYLKINDYSKAESFFLEAIVLYEKVWGKGHQEYIGLLENLCGLYQDIGNYSKAEPYFLEKNDYYEKTYGKEHPSYAASLGGLGLLYNNMGDYVKAESYFLKAVSIYDKTFGKEQSDYAWLLGNMGLMYHDMGNYAKAERYYLNAAAIYEKVQGKENIYYANSILNLGTLYNNMGDYAKAERYYMETKTIYEKILNKEDPSYASLLNNMGGLFCNMGDYANAERYELEAAAIREKLHGKEHIDYAYSLVGMGEVYYRTGDYAKAERCNLEAAAIQEKALGNEHPVYAGTLNNLGLLYGRMGDYAKAEYYCLKAAAILKKTRGEWHPDYAALTDSLGELYRNSGDYTKAERCYLEVAAIREKTLGKDHPDYAVSLDELFLLYLCKNEYARALAYKKEQIKINSGIVTKNFSFQTERQREAYWYANSYSFEASYSLSFYNPVPESNVLNYENALFSKGLLLRTTNAVRDAIYSSGNAEMIGQFEQLGALRQQISRLRQKEGSNEEYLQNLEAQADALDKELTRASSAFRDLKADMAMQWQDVRDSLRQGEAAIEFVSFNLFDKKWTDTVQYAALVLTPNSKAPEWVPLCNEEALQNILGKAEGKKPDKQVETIYNTYGMDLYALVWKPLEEKLENVKTIYYSPSGLLHKVAFGALRTGEDDFDFDFDDESDEDYDFLDNLGEEGDKKRLVDKYDLNLVSSTREVAHLNRNPVEIIQISSAVLYGGLDYNTNEETMRITAQKNKKENMTAVAAAPPAGVTRGGGAWVQLEGTQEEALKIQDYLNKKQIPNTLYQGSNGNEESFKGLDGAKTELIHLATHGFFLTDTERVNGEIKQAQSGSAIKAADNPLLRSGLLFAGGNHAWTNHPVKDVEDGILYADEIAGINLLGAKLIVMSACQTGLGDVNNGEGVFGLQRAFKLAGVETLVMSLWEVNDAATAILMSTFYQEWLFTGKSKQEAFKEAQKKVRVEFSEPFLWAAFVMMD